MQAACQGVLFTRRGHGISSSRRTCPKNLSVLTPCRIVSNCPADGLGVRRPREALGGNPRARRRGTRHFLAEVGGRLRLQRPPCMQGSALLEESRASPSAEGLTGSRPRLDTGASHQVPCMIILSLVPLPKNRSTSSGNRSLDCVRHGPMRHLGQKPRYQEGPRGVRFRGVSLRRRRGCQRTEVSPDRWAEAPSISLSESRGLEEHPENARRIARGSSGHTARGRGFMK
jgi:hypothetical protein